MPALADARASDTFLAAFTRLSRWVSRPGALRLVGRASNPKPGSAGFHFDLSTSLAKAR